MVDKLHKKISKQISRSFLNHCLRKKQSFLQTTLIHTKVSQLASSVFSGMRRPTSGIHVRGQGHTVMTSRERERVGHSSPSLLGSGPFMNTAAMSGAAGVERVPVQSHLTHWRIPVENRRPTFVTNVPFACTRYLSKYGVLP